MNPRYYKHWWRKNAFNWYKITEDGKVYSRNYNVNFKTWGKWKEVRNGAFSKLMEENVEEVSEGDYFLEQI